MKLRFPVLLCLLVLNLAARSPAQEPSHPNRPPGAAQRSAEPAGHARPLGDMLGDFGRLLNKQILTDATVSVTQPVDLPELDGLTPPQKINLIERSLFLNNFTLVDADKDAVMVLGPGRNPRSFGVPLYVKGDELPAGERVFTYLFKLEHADPIEVTGVLQQFIPPGNDVNFTAFEKYHFLTATAPTSVMRAVIRLVAACDAEGSGH